MAYQGHSSGYAENAALVGRRVERASLDQMIAAVRAGQSRVLVLHGAAGVGKSALLEYARASAGAARVLRAAGVEPEADLPFALLHQLCAPLLDRLARLAAPQRVALETVFGLREGKPPDRFLAGLAVLSLLSDASQEEPLLCLIDDAQWMDRASAQALGFVARRLLAESVALVFVARRPDPDLIGLPGMEVTGLRDTDARALLASSVTYTGLDRHIRDRILAEAGGNPLALLELPRGLSTTQMAGGLGLLEAGPLPARIGASLPGRVAGLPGQTRLLLLVAAAEPAGDPALVWRAAARLGITPATALAGGTDGLLSVAERVTFGHPLVRSAVYQAAAAEDRRAAHLALAEVTDARADPDRRAWHLASAAAGPDEGVAAELERSAGRAQARGGLATAAAFLQRSVALSIDTARRAERAVTAAGVSLQAGDLGAARRFADIADGEAQAELQRARADLVRSEIALAAGRAKEAPPLLLTVARRLEPIDGELARDAYLLAWGTAALIASDANCLVAISQAMRTLPDSTRPPSALDLVMAGYALLVTEGRAAAVPVLQLAVTALADLSARDVVRWGWVVDAAGPAVWDDRAMRARYGRTVEVVRAAGALTELPFCLASWGTATAWTGDFAAAAAIADEAEAVAAATGVPVEPHTRLRLAGLRGRETEAEALIGAAIQEGGAGGASLGVAVAQWAAAVLYNGLGRYEQAMSAARACAGIGNLWISAWVLPELVEAAARAGADDVARAALDGLVEATRSSGTDWALGVLARSRALLTDGAAAESLYREAIQRLGRTELRPELARAHLLYGEWLGGRHQRAEARVQMRTAHDMVAGIGMEAFAERARRQLLTTGESVRKRSLEAATSDRLTAQERQIALLVRDGLSNPEVGARLFLSPRTIEWHLRKIFTKLAITSRRQLREALPLSGHEPVLE